MPNFFHRIFLGGPKDFRDRSIFHKLALIPFLAWIGLGADGLSSSSYGPEEAFRTLGEHTYLAVGIALLTALTVILIAAAYSRIIESFPQGGGGFVVATKTLGPNFGVVSGSALLIDYILTIAVSVAAAWDALFSFLPQEYLIYSFGAKLATILLLALLNMRGVKESVIFLTPIFIIFLITHALLIIYGIGSHLGEIAPTAQRIQSGFNTGWQTLGGFGMLFLFLHAFSMGGGTYTGIEAVSNGLQIMREPKVRTAKTTMVYMAVSLAITAAGLLLCYLLWHVQSAEGKTMNAILLEKMASGFTYGHAFVVTALFSEGALLIVAAQAGFIDGPRVLSVMAADSWLPRRFTTLSDRLTMSNGVLLMSLSAAAALIYTHGDVRALVVMYSINVFLTFSISMIGMVKYSVSHRLWLPTWRRRTMLFAVGFLFCITILVVTVLEKFKEGGWLTLLVTGFLVTLCFIIHAHYKNYEKGLDQLTTSLELPNSDPNAEVIEPTGKSSVAGMLVSKYNGLGIHGLLGVMTQLNHQFEGVVFLSVGQIDAGRFKGVAAVPDLQFEVEEHCRKYVEFARNLGIPATYRTSVGLDVVEELTHLCGSTAVEFPKIIYFANQIVFHKERWYHAILHNQTVFALQRKLIWAGHKIVIWPIRVA